MNKNENFIREYFVEEKICDDLIDYYKKNSEKITEGNVEHYNKIADEIDKEIKDCYQLTIHFNNTDQQIYNYRIALDKIITSYIKEFKQVDSIGKFNITTNFNIQHYKSGGGFKKWHCERGGKSTMGRLLVFMTYLNDVDDGGTDFLYQNLTTQAKKGKTIIWPAEWTHTHKGQISEKKEKYIVTGWYNFI